MILFKLFWVFFKIGLFAIGGAYSFLPLLEKDIVESYNWLTKEEFLDILAMVEMFPAQSLLNLLPIQDINWQVFQVQ